MDVYINLQKKLNILVGMHPLSKDAHPYLKNLMNIWRGFIISSLILISTLMVVDIIIKQDLGLVLLAENIVNTAIIIGCTIRATYYYINLESVRYIYDIVNATFLTDVNECAEDINVKSKVEKLKWFDIFWRVNVMFSVEVIVILPLFIAEERSLPLPAWMPWNWTENDFLFIISVAYEIATNLFVGIIFPNADLFFMTITIITAYQFDILSENYKSCVYTALHKCGFNKQEIKLFKESFNKYQENLKFKQIETYIQTNNYKDELNKIFVECTTRHQHLFEICKHFENFFAPIMFASIGMMVLYSIFMAYCLVVADGQNIGFFAQYLISSILQLFMFSFAGQLLTSSTEEMNIKVYDIPWYLMDEHFKYRVLFTLVRLLKPVQFTAGYFIIISYNSFLKIMKTIYSFFALLQQSTRNNDITY